MERQFFADADPLGFILFARNIESPEQVRRLTADLRAVVNRPDAPILIDQEGGRVRRLRPPHWREALPMQPYGALYGRDPEAGKRALALNTALQAAELAGLGIDVNCAPVLDVPVADAHDVIGDRAFSYDPAVVAALGRVVVDTMLGQGVLPVIKHIPGHGRSIADSHLHLPEVMASRATLEASDFVPFRALADAPLAMTAHILYTALDAERVATFSPSVISSVVRDFLGFEGVLISDDLSMKALSGSFRERAERALEAGCDLVLHCNGDPDEMADVVAGTGRLAGTALQRWQRVAALRQVPPVALPADAEVQLAALLA